MNRTRTKFKSIIPNWIISIFEISSIILGIVAVCAFAIYILAFSPSFWGKHFLETGQIGDTLGGITSPIINIAAAVLIYVSFKAQVKANREQREELKNEIERTGRTEIARQLDNSLQEISKELDSLELSFTQYVYAISMSDGKSRYSQNGPERIGRRTVAINYATLLFPEHRYWNNDNINPAGKIPKYYNFDPQQLFYLFNQLRYIQATLKVAITQLKNLSNYKTDPAYIKLKSFYVAKFESSLMRFGAALLESNEEYKKKGVHFVLDQVAIDDFFEFKDYEQKIINEEIWKNSLKFMNNMEHLHKDDFKK